jgi:hypothetical protein
VFVPVSDYTFDGRVGAIAMGSMAKANSKGLKGQPQRHDHCKGKQSDWVLLVLIEA